MKECCNNCVFLKPCKKFEYESEQKWKWFYVCTALANEKDGWCLYINNPIHEMCEMFTEKERE